MKQRMHCRVVAITGRSGSGKSTVSARYAALGYTVLDSDKVAREITQVGEPCLLALAEAFGLDILDERGALRRSTLAARAFATPEGTRKLTKITHPAIIARLLEGVAEAQKQYEQADAPHALVFVDGAVIVDAAFEPYCDSILVVTAPEKDAVSRIVLRDGISKQAAHDRLAAQLPEKRLLAAADYRLCNDTTPQALLVQADAVLEKLLKDASQQ